MMNWHDEQVATAPLRQPMATSFAESMHEMLALLELQIELFKIDFRQCLKRLVLPGILIVCSLVLAMACVPIVLLLFVALLIEAGTSASIAMLIVTLVGLGLSAGLAVAAFARLRTSMNVFSRSREEWRSTMHSIKRTLRDRPSES